LKEELYNIGLGFMWRKQQEYNLREITKIVKDRSNDIERQNILAKLSEKTQLTLYREMNFFWGKRLYIEWCLRKERSGIVWLLARLWLLKGVRMNTEKAKCPLYVGEEDVVNTYYWIAWKLEIRERNLLLKNC
jgi:hypothetical protein